MFLRKKVFNHSKLNTAIAPEEIVPLAKAVLDVGAGADARHFKALAMAKLAYVGEVFDICARFRCKAFASIVEKDANPTNAGGLRKDYGYLFERFFYFLEDAKSPQEQGVIVFDELEKSQSHVLIDQAHRYFKDTATGKHRASLIVLEPFFVHSDLTTGIQIADLIAYCVSWGFRLPQMTKPARLELEPFVGQIKNLRFRTMRERNNNPNFEIWSFTHISDLRTQNEKDFAQ